MTLDVILDGLTSWAMPISLLLAAGLALMITLRLVPEREGPGRRDLILFLGSAVWWSGCALTENLPLAPGTRLIFGNLAWFGITLAPLSACFVLWSSSFGHRRPVSSGWRAAAGLLGLAVCLVAFVNPAQSMYAQIIVSADNDGPLRYIHGRFFFVAVAVIYLIVLVTMLVTGWAQRRLSWRRRRVHAGLVLAISVPLVTSGFYASGSLLLFAYDPTPFTFLFTAPVLAWLLAYNGLCDPLPIARRALLEVLADAVIILDHDGRIVELNQAARRLAQLPPQPLGKMISSLTHWREGAARAMANPREPVSVNPPSGSPRFFEMTATVLEESGLTAGHLLLVRDMTLRQETENRLQATLDALNVQLADNLRLQAELHGEARRDPLTGAYNRRALEETLPVIVREALHSRRPVSVAMIDLDHFKSINDEYGHVFGDGVLKAFATHLTGLSRSDDSLYRMGGEEFLSVLPNTTPEEATSLVEGWLESLGAGLMVEGKHLNISFSAGINAIPSPESDATLLLAHADSATYLAKRRGRNQVVSYQPGDPTLPVMAARPSFVLRTTGDPAPEPARSV
jgi:diguanylate cyclase (GGDEF)-like protein